MEVEENVLEVKQRVHTRRKPGMAGQKAGEIWSVLAFGKITPEAEPRVMF